MRKTLTHLPETGLTTAHGHALIVSRLDQSVYTEKSRPRLEDDPTITKGDAEYKVARVNGSPRFSGKA